MLTIAKDTLPQSGLSYLAFRIAFRETLERMTLAQQVGDDCDCFGFLSEVPFLKGVATHVQLDLLSDTWHKHSSADPVEATLLDEAVIYASCETAAWVVEHEPLTAQRFLRGGPVADTEFSCDRFLAEELRALHLNLASEGDFLMISQFEDLPPREARHLKHEFGLIESRFDPLFEALGRWEMSAEFLGNLVGLLTHVEIVRAAWDLGVK